AASAAAPPPVLPPGVRVGSQGLTQRPKRGLLVCQSAAYIGTLVFPRMTAPALRTQTARPESAEARALASAGIPCVVGKPRTSIVSLIVTGRPSRGASLPLARR